MADRGGVDLAIVGLNFGAAFAPIYQRHPDIGRLAIVDLDPELLGRVGDQHGVDHRYHSLAELLASDEWNAVHIATPVITHGPLALQVLNSGRHCASAVPMALELAEMTGIIEVSEAAGLRYMMMETAVYSREYRYAEQLYRQGDLGDLTYFTGSHLQNHDGYPAYWMGFPPMGYLTHALSPALQLSQTVVEQVSCLGSGFLQPEQRGIFDNRFPVEIGLFKLSVGDLAAQVTMSWFQTARPYQEGFSVYGTKASVEWPQLEGDPLTKFTLHDVVPGIRSRKSAVERVTAPDHTIGLPAEIADFASSHSHGGSHPHLVHEFVRSVVEKRPAAIDARRAAEFTAPGICAHQSAMTAGSPVAVPSYH